MNLPIGPDEDALGSITMLKTILAWDVLIRGSLSDLMVASRQVSVTQARSNAV
jgi:hypothetical protein